MFYKGLQGLCSELNEPPAVKHKLLGERMSVSNSHGWARKMTQQLRGFVALAQNPG